MMSSYTLIPVTALTGYVILFVSFAASKKTKLTKSFMQLLTVFSIWTTGSLFLRMSVPPSTGFWFYVSIDALFLMCFTYHRFLSAFTYVRQKTLSRLWFVISVLIIVINHVSGGFFIGPPSSVHTGEEIAFVYDIGWQIAIPLALNALIIADCVYILIRYSRENFAARRQLRPIILGVFVLFMGNVLASLPVFNSFPIDILSGIINACFIFYAMYSRRLFRLTLLVSKSTCYVISAVVIVIVFSYIAKDYQDMMLKSSGLFRSDYILIFAVGYMLAVMICYYLLKRFFDHVFVRNEMAQAEAIKDFSTSISKTLKVDEILSRLINVIQDTLHVEKSYVCLLDYDGKSYSIVQSTSPLDEKTLVIEHDNPLVTLMSNERECVLIEDLRRSAIYRSMWEREKKQLEDLGIRCFLPLVDEEELVGIVLLSNKEKHTAYNVQDRDYLQSLASVCSIAVKNSRLYEKAWLEARTDDLTGLLNRNYFYEKLEEIYSQDMERELALILLSLDDFKLYNQLYGSAEGDAALRNAAAIIKGTVGSRGIAARYEGKIFAVILPGSDILTAVSLAETLREQVRSMNSRFCDYAIKTITCSCGVCTIPLGASSTSQLVSNADLALYNAKRNGKNCTRSYSEGIVKNSVSPSKIEEAGNFDPDVYEEYASTIYALTAAIDAKDHYTFNHSQNVCYYSQQLADAYGMDDDCIEIIKEAALLHDIGKIGIPEHILKKPGRLTDEEYGIMKSHVEQSIGIIRHLPSLDYVIPAVIGHHERYDGRGYPRGLKGEEIPLLARMLCIADSFDAMISKRSYKEAYTLDYAIDQLISGSGTQFDPVLAELFVKLLKTEKVEIRYDASVHSQQNR